MLHSTCKKLNQGCKLMAFGEPVQLLLILCFLQSVSVTTRGEETAGCVNYYTIEIEEGEDVARDVARRNGLDYVLSVGNLKGFHILRTPRSQARRLIKCSAKMVLNRLSQDPQVKWVEQQEIHEVKKRDKVVLPNSPFLSKRSSFFEPLEREKNDHIPTAVFKVLQLESEMGNELRFNDPMWPKQWELYNNGQTSGPKRFDLNVMPAWQRHITGSGVVVTVVDDGIDHKNTDLKGNYDPQASFDFNDHFDTLHDPIPNSSDKLNGHGTKCAGEVAMQANNSFCGVGIAFNARIGGIRILDGKVTDALEAAALSYNNNYIDIYTCCWGPNDNGMVFDGPRNLTTKALKEGAEKGRGGKGNIFIWASGNGGLANDHCGTDGYVNNIYTVAVGAVSNLGLSPFYSEACAAVMAVVPTGGSSAYSYSFLEDENSLVTTELDGKCTNTFKGTSSAAPMAAAVIALVLQANPDLTWRDVQHLIVRTCKVCNPMDEDWSINGAGYHVHHKYGFGMLDAGRLVKKALRWTNVGPQRQCVVDFHAGQTRSIAISTEHPLILNLTTDGCTGTENEVDSLEHVQVTVSLSSICRGDLSIFLTSPYGTVSQLLGIREADNSKEGLTNWTFTTVHSWGEDPKGTWKLTVKDDSVYTFGCRRRYSETTAGFITQFKLTLWGTYRTKFPKKEKLKHSGVLYNRYNLQESLTEFIENSQVNLELAEAFVSENIKRVNEADIPSVKTKKKASVNNSPSALSSEFGKYLLHLWSAFWNSTTSESNSASDKREVKAIEGERSEPASPLVDARALHEGTANTGQR